MNENIDIECEKITFNGKTAELENVDIKALLLQVAEILGAKETLGHITDLRDFDLDNIVEFIDETYGMEDAVGCLDDERTEDLREHLNAG